MACLVYLRIKIFGGKKKKTYVPVISNKMIKLRSSLNIVDDKAVKEEIKRRDILWRIRPLIDLVRQGCLRFPRSEKVCIDGQIIPLPG